MAVLLIPNSETCFAFIVTVVGGHQKCYSVWHGVMNSRVSKYGVDVVIVTKGSYCPDLEAMSNLCLAYCMVGNQQGCGMCPLKFKL